MGFITKQIIINCKREFDWELIYDDWSGCYKNICKEIITPIVRKDTIKYANIKNNLVSFLMLVENEEEDFGDVATLYIIFEKMVDKPSKIICYSIYVEQDHDLDDYTLFVVNSLDAEEAKNSLSSKHKKILIDSEEIKERFKDIDCFAQSKFCLDDLDAFIFDVKEMGIEFEQKYL